MLVFTPKDLDKNQQFILGRNLLQAGDVVFNAINFFENLKTNLSRYTIDGENHLLNGILFEIYFNSHGEFRKERFKLHQFDKIIAMRKVSSLSKSFEFIVALLEQYKEIRLFWDPSSGDEPIDIDVIATTQDPDDSSAKKKQYTVIEAIKFHSVDILDQIKHYNIIGLNSLALRRAIANYLGAPEELVEIASAIPINNITYPASKEEIDLFGNL